MNLRLALLLLPLAAAAAVLIVRPGLGRADAAPAMAREDAPVPVKVVRVGERWELQRGGKPYTVRGAGGSDNLDLLVKCGGNSIRSWGAENAGKDLDAAQKHGLTLTLGIWLGHKEHGFRYDDPKMVADQLENAKKVVRQYRNHPALLAWGIGNEMEGDGKDPLVWKAVEDIAKAIKELDPNHPTLTVVAEIGEGGIKAREVARLCPDIDILGVNSYGGLPSLPKRLKESGWTKPFIVTEFGPNGPWEVGKTPWGAALEPSSTEKYRTYRENYKNSIAANADWCLGSYVFLWGNKVEGTPTWFGMFLPGSGEKLGPVDAMTEAWTGKEPTAKAPEITEFSSPAARQTVAPGSKQTVTCRATGKPGTTLTYQYEIRPDDTGKSRPEPGQVAPEAIKGVVPANSKGGEESFTAPTVPGAYRLYVYIRDGKGGAATANFPFLIQAP